MELTIIYESSWRNSFLDGSNNVELPKKGRGYIGSSTALKKEENYIERNITNDTIMGILNRLIGDQRKLYQARDSNNYFFKDVESLVSFKDNAEITNETVYLRNMNGFFDQGTFTGTINIKHPLLTSEYSKDLWSILYLTEEQLFDFIINKKLADVEVNMNPLALTEKFEELSKIKKIEDEETVQKAIDTLNEIFPDIKYTNSKDEIIPGALYISSIRLQVKRLSELYDLSGALSKQGNIGGICPKSFSKSEFMYNFSTGGQRKKVWGNPYVQTLRIKGQGEVKNYLKKARGKLKINIDVSKEEGKKIKEMIENAGINTFYLGKKGLAYVSKIRA